MSDKFIDIKEVIASKNKSLARWIPGPFMNYIKRILHEEDINNFLKKNGDLYGVDFCDAVIEEYEISYEVISEENIPREGGCIFVSNHPLGGMDAMAVVSAMRDIRTDIVFIVNDILLNLKNMEGMFIGVNKVGKNRKESLRKVDELFGTDKAIFVFPAGLVSRRHHGEIRDLEWKKTFITRARKYKQPILPVFVDGRLTDFFYKVANFRKFLGLSVNIEMFYLVNELYKQSGIHVPIVFGEVIHPEELTSEKSDKEWAQIIKDKTYNLAAKIEKEKRFNE